MGGGAYVIDGERACPPEDVGGAHGYQEMLQILLSNPESEESLEIWEWLGGDFDLRLANAALSRILS